MDVSIVIGQYSIDVLEGPYTKRTAATPEAVKFAEVLVSKLEHMRDFAAVKLLNLYNETWLDDDIGELTEDGLREKLVDPEITIYDEIGYALVYFGDSMVFAGHSIVVTVDGGEIADAEIAG